VDSTRPYTSTLTQTCRLIDFSWPRQELGLNNNESRNVTARTVRLDSPMGSVLSPMLLRLYEMNDGLSSAGETRLQKAIADLVVTAALEIDTPGHADIRSREQYDAMLRFIERNLEDPNLSAETIAAAFFMSTRTVHRLFARFETSAAAAIRDRRLEACRQMMLSPSHRSCSISYLADQFGFSSLQVFSRMFTAKYGLAPKLYRDARTSRSDLRLITTPLNGE
jgi:AraC-like DNA-binding protein